MRHMLKLAPSSDRRTAMKAAAERRTLVDEFSRSCKKALNVSRSATHSYLRARVSDQISTCTDFAVLRRYIVRFVKRDEFA